MSTNPYEPPNTPPVSQRSKVFGLLMLIISYPAALICGVSTCGGVTYATQSEQVTHSILPGIIGTVVAVATWLYIRSFGTRT